jgi:hypothetical protein
MVVNCVQRQPYSNVIAIDITGNQACMFRTEQIWNTMTFGFTDQARVDKETATANS